MNTVGYTSQITAGFRAVELAHNPQPIIVDQLAQHLAGAALSTAASDYCKLQQAQGTGHSLRVPARNRIVDDSVMEALQQQQHLGSDGIVQVVNIGCGMDTKPWRLQLPLPVYWFDIDQPAVMQLKQQLLQQAGAAVAPCITSTTSASGGGTATSPCVPAAHAGVPVNAPPAGPDDGQQQPQQPQRQQQQHVLFPLLQQRWSPLSADLAVVPLASCLDAAGFQRHSRPTVWIAEALLYYLPLETACELLRSMRELSGPGSRLIATCIDSTLQQAHLKLPSEHYFSTNNVAWHFCMDDLAAAIGQTGWRIEGQPETAAQLARERYGRETYVALYGGAECCFTAVPV